MLASTGIIIDIQVCSQRNFGCYLVWLTCSHLVTGWPLIYAGPKTPHSTLKLELVNNGFLIILPILWFVQILAVQFRLVRSHVYSMLVAADEFCSDPRSHISSRIA